ncbi:MAG: hypothetical protein FJX75_12945 [Armatimonadetes bacterium]|nr:hypothetical protein [Armatimonadota bacterium]
MRLIWLAVLPMALGVSAAWGQWEVAPDGRGLTVTTPTLRATFRDGTLVALENRTGGDSLFVARGESQAAAALRDAEGFSSADATTQVAVTREGEGARISLRGLAGDATARLTLDLGIETDGALTVRESGERERPQLLSACWGIAGIDAARTRIVVPANGGCTIDALRGPGALPLSWPGNWQAALIVLQGEKGGFTVWAEDAEAQFKSVEVRRFGRETTLSFGAETRDAYEAARQVTSPVWRVQAYQGDWQVPALAYRSRMERALDLTPVARRQPEWIQDIRLVVRVSNDVTVDDLRGLAAKVDPRQTLLYVPGWRKLPYDVLYPDYEPREGFVEWCRAAQELGFRVMPHGNLVGIGPKSPELPQVEQYVQTSRVGGEKVGWYLDRPDHPGQIYCLNPASSEVRRFLIDHFRRAWEQVRFDALHLDFPVIVSTHDGDVEGMTCALGVEVYLQELQAALPGVALGTEGLNETLLACSFAQLGEPFWVSPTPGMGLHPIRSTVFAPFCGLYGHLGLPSQATSLPAFLTHHDFFDALGGWPTLSLDGPLDPANGGTDFVLREAAYFQQQRLMPAPEEARWPEELLAWRGADGAISAVFDTPPGRRLAPRSAPGDPVWALLSKVNTYDGPGSVADWRAFDGAHLFGLDPERRYPLAAQTLDPKALHLLSASAPIIVQEVRDNARRALFRLGGQTAVIADFVESAASAAAGILVEGRQEPISAGANFSAGPGASGGEALPSISAHPPWQGGKLGGLTYGEFPVTVPAEGRTVLRFAIGLGDLTDATQVETDAKQPMSDGVTFVVSVDQREVFREHWLRGKWGRRQVDLTPYAGKSIIVGLATGPGPDNEAGWDWALWGQPRVISLGSAEGQLLKLQAFSPHGAGEACFGDADQPGRVAAAHPTEGGTLLDIELPRPQPFGLLFETTPAAAGSDLAELPFIIGSTSGGILHEGSVWGSGTVGADEVDGTPCKTISGHPPDSGRTALDWCLQLPTEPVQLRFHAQVRKGGGPVAFEVQVNGQSLWHLPMPYPNGWKEGAVDLAPWAGKPVLLSLVTDSVGSNNCDWAAWGDVRLVGR